MHDFDLEPGYHNYHLYEQHNQELIKKHALEPGYATIKKCEALTWHANLLHGGAPQKDLSRSRHSQITHFYFDDCRYCTPMNSTTKPFYRNPEWISDQPVGKFTAKKSLLRRKLNKIGLNRL
jgi:hypothetical protein